MIDVVMHACMNSHLHKAVQSQLESGIVSQWDAYLFHETFYSQLISICSVQKNYQFCFEHQIVTDLIYNYHIWFWCYISWISLLFSNCCEGLIGLHRQFEEHKMKHKGNDVFNTNIDNEIIEVYKI
jgi:hypothetical protein